MIVNLFEIPIYIGKINLKKIKLKNSKLEKTWVSDISSSYKKNLNEDIQNIIDKNSLSYLLNLIVKLFEEKQQEEFKIVLINIWENIYKNKDFQEPHIHIRSDFSFIIYKKVEEKGGKTLFFNPSRNFIEPFPNISYLYAKTFQPFCKEGQIILFPSFLEHMVLKTSNQHTISGNLRFIKQ
tara:strand:+ start:63 stop:605 length:543 start_codon:yes stop_codon:yes gene_type:complete